jgi:hypothetical protein
VFGPIIGGTQLSYPEILVWITMDPTSNTATAATVTGAAGMAGLYGGSLRVSASRIFWFCRDFADTPSAITAGIPAQNMHIENLLLLFDPIHRPNQ